MRSLRNDERWFQSRLSRPNANLTVLAGTDLANRIVAVFQTAEEAKEAVDAHNARLNEKGSASAPTLPSRGSNNPYEENAVNKQHRITAPAAPATISVAPAGPVRAATLDPFITRMENYVADIAEFNASEDDAAVDPGDQLCRDIRSGRLVIGSNAGAALALRRLVALDCVIDTEGDVMIEAVLAFLEGRA